MPRPTQASVPEKVVDKPHPVQVEGHQGAGHEHARVEVRQVPDLEHDRVDGGPEDVI